MEVFDEPAVACGNKHPKNQRRYGPGTQYLHKPRVVANLVLYLSGETFPEHCVKKPSNIVSIIHPV